jgi:hypothetical protein
VSPAKYKRGSDAYPSVSGGGSERSPPHNEQDPRDAYQTENADQSMTEDRGVNQTISQGRSESQPDQQVADE